MIFSSLHVHVYACLYTHVCIHACIYSHTCIPVTHMYPHRSLTDSRLIVYSAQQSLHSCRFHKYLPLLYSFSYHFITISLMGQNIFILRRQIKNIFCQIKHMERKIRGGGGGALLQPPRCWEKGHQTLLEGNCSSDFAGHTCPPSEPFL